MEEQQLTVNDAAPAVAAPPTESDIASILAPENFNTVDSQQKNDTVEVSEPSEHPQENAEPENEQPAGDSEGQESDAKTTETYELNLSDGTVKVTLDELKSSYMRQSDYTKKTAEIKQQKEEYQQNYTQLETNLINGMQQLLQKFDPAAPLLRHREALIAEINDARSIGDTVEYTAKRLDLQDIDAQIASINHEKELIFKAGALQSEKQVERNVQQEVSKLYEKLPELKDEGKFKEFAVLAHKAFLQTGFTEQEIQEQTRNPDARLMEMSYFAGQYLKMKDSAPQVASVLKDKVVTPKASNATTGDSSAWILDRLKQNPNDEQAIGALLAPR